MRYRRSIVPGGCYFFTVKLEARGSRLLVDHAYVLKKAVREVRASHPFDVNAWVTMPDHLHAVLTLPQGDDRIALRWSMVKAGFAKRMDVGEAVSRGGHAHGERAIWQRRFREHLIRDDVDLQRHIDYVHYNPVRHGYVSRAADWPFSSMHRFVRLGTMSIDWGGTTPVRQG